MASRIHITAKKTSTPVLKPKGRPLQRYPDQIESEIASPAAEEPLHTPDQANQTSSSAPPVLGHHFGQMAVWPGGSASVQAKRTIGQPNGQSEQAADPVADPIMRKAEPASTEEPESLQTKAFATPMMLRVQRQAEQQQDEDQVQSKEQTEQTPTVTLDLEARLQASQGKGQALPAEIRALMEPRFGHDFGQVYADGEAAKMNQELNAQTFTHQQDVFLGARRYSPESGEGQRLLAHKLPHVMQRTDKVQMQQRVEKPVLQTKESIDENSQNESHHRIASDITGIFEGGKPGSLQTKDAGIISYGKHQATLASGALYSVLKAYTELSKTNTATKIAEYLPQVQKKDVTLRESAVFIQLLKEAANEPEMAQAQEEVFDQKYWEPASKIAKQADINSALGKVIFYDTKIQGGLEDVLKNTKQRLANKEYTEQEFLSIFLEERRKRLHTIAQKNRSKAKEERDSGKEKDAKALETNAEMLENSAKGRVGALEKLVQSGDLNLVGDEKGQVKIGGTKIAGLGKGATGINKRGGTSSDSASPTIGTDIVASSDLNVRQPQTISASNPPPPTEQTLIQMMIVQGQRDENGLTNAVFYTRHPELAGKPLAKGSPFAKEWLMIRNALVQPTLAIPARTPLVESLPSVSPPITAATPWEPRLDAVFRLAQLAYDAVAGWFSSDEQTTPATPQPPAAEQQTGLVKLPGVTTSNAVKQASIVRGVSTTEGEKRFHTNTPTVGGSTLDTAKTRADKGDAGTTYSLEGEGLASSLMSGDKDATVFYCSGLVIWTLAAAGYDVSKAIVGVDGMPYTWTKVITKKDKKGKDVERETEVKVTLKQLIDGEPQAVEAMTIAEQKKMKNGGSVGRLNGEGHALGHTDRADALAVKGAAGAFEFANIGSEILEVDQKPGDFAQSRRTTVGKGTDTDVRHRGAGHAWQVWTVRARGAAIFGLKGSPVPETVGLTGWQEGVKFLIDKDTDPSLVGDHTVLTASRIEANVAGAGTLASKKKNAKADGGVQITREYDVPDKGKGYTGYVVYYGRLGVSPWANWKRATKPS